MRCALIVLCGALLLPAGARAQSSNAPPGNSGIDEYLESVPSSQGNRPSGSALSDKPGSVDPEVAAGLRAQGRDGEELERLVGATGSDRSPANTDDSVSNGSSAQGRPPLSSVRRALAGEGGGDDGLGVGLPLVLGLTVVAAVVAALLRRRRMAR